MTAFLDNNEGPIMAFFFVLFIGSFLFYFLKGSKYELQSKIILIVGTALWFSAIIMDVGYLTIIGFIILYIGLAAGFYGKQRQLESPLPLYVFIVSHLLIQGIGYLFDIDFMKNIIITEATNTTSTGFGTVSPLILAVGTYYYLLKKKDETST